MQRNSVSLAQDLRQPDAGRDIVIKAVNVSKCYQIYDKPQERLKQAIVPRLYRLVSPFTKQKREPTYFREFWALRDVSFEVRRGELVGIIGRNGAGKSTLLQIVVGTMAPTMGTVEVSGRVAALLELGSGFNPEFTGRENVYLNASLLGLSTAQTQAKFDEIEGFADIGDFIDQPVKSYSSGMLMRLAFAVQTAVEPSLLIVDEALAVGDVFFQTKCMARLRRLVSQGVTILLVTHDVGTVRQMCDRVILLQQGRLVASGAAVDVTDNYLRLELEDRNRIAPQNTNAVQKQLADHPSPSVEGDRPGKPIGSTTALSPASGCVASAIIAKVNDRTDLMLGADLFVKRAQVNRVGNRHAEVINVQMLKEGELRDVFDFNDLVTLRQVVWFRKDLRNVNVAYKIRTVQGIDVVFGDTRIEGEIERQYIGGCTYVFEWDFRLSLMHGNYCVMSGLAHPPSEQHDDWVFVDMIPFCFDFRMTPRKGGMIGGFVVWKNQLKVSEARGLQDTAIAGNSGPNT
jgi:lipopolysaccharide transport system ATP-binding protein